MAETEDLVSASDIECCPVLTREPCCDTIRLRYRLPWRPLVGEQRLRVPGEIVLHFLLQRCSESLALGDVAHSTTLFPGEQVRLFTSDRHTRWTFDSASNLSYRHETTSEESYFTWAMARSMTDLTINESGEVESDYEESWAEGGGSGGVNLFGIIQIGGGGGGGQYDAESSLEFSRSLSRHAEASSAMAAASVRAKSATAVGEVERRSHAEGESESHFESSSRVFRNPNRCHAVTFFFYKIMKLQRIRFSLVAVERRIEDPAAPTGAFQNVRPDTNGGVAIRRQDILATNEKRLDIERMARTSAAERRQAAQGGDRHQLAGGVASLTPLGIRDPIDRKLRSAALTAIDADLAAVGILDPEKGTPTAKIIAELSWERQDCLPTPGLLVKGCLDECSICEPALQKQIELELENQRLQNELLKRQVELLDKHQDYRCCPAGSDETLES